MSSTLFFVGEKVWYQPAILGYGYTAAADPKGIPAVIASLSFATRSPRHGQRFWCVITFPIKGELKRLAVRTTHRQLARRGRTTKPVTTSPRAGVAL